MSEVDATQAAMWLWRRSREPGGAEIKNLLYQAFRRTGQPNVGLLAEHEPELVLALYDGLAPIDEDIEAMEQADGMLREIWQHRH